MEDNIEKVKERISKEETLTNSNYLFECKVDVDNNSTKLVTTYKYFGVNISSFNIFHNEVTNKVDSISDKTCVKSVKVQTERTRTNKFRNKATLRTSVMKTLRSIARKTRLDWVVRKNKTPKRDIKAYVKGTEDTTIAKIVMDKSTGLRSIGRPSKRLLINITDVAEWKKSLDLYRWIKREEFKNLKTAVQKHIAQQ